MKIIYGKKSIPNNQNGKGMKLIYGSNTAKKLSNNLSYVNEYTLSTPYGKKFHEPPISLMQEIESSRIGSKSVPELFKIDDYSMWWFLHPIIFPFVAKSVNFIIKFETLIDRSNPDSIHLDGEFEKFDIIKEICLKHHLKFSYSKKKFFKFRLVSKFISIFQCIRYRKLTEKKYNERLKQFQKNNDSIPSFTDKVVFCSHTGYRRDIYDLKKRKNLSGEYLLSYYIENIKKMKYQISGLDVDYQLKGNPGRLSKRLTEDYPWIPIEAILEQYPTKINQEFLKNYSQIIKNKNFQNLFQFNEINLWPYLENEFKKQLFLPALPMFIKTIYSLSKFFEDNKPKNIFIMYETGPYGLATILACEKNNIKTFGLQHGALMYKHPDYSHFSFRSIENPYGMPLPNTLILFGNALKKFLVDNSHYPENKLHVFGNPDFFEIDDILSNLNSKELKKDFKLPENKKIILFTSSMLQKYYYYQGRDLDEKVFQKLLDHFANNPEYLVIFKPHPHELNVDSYHKMIKKHKCNNFIIKQHNIFELLVVTDIVVSVFSGSMVDAIVAKKPTIRVTFLEEKDDPRMFSEYGIYFESTLSTLPENLIKLINDSSLQQELFKNRNQFVYEQYNIPNPNALSQLKKILTGN